MDRSESNEVPLHRNLLPKLKCQKVYIHLIEFFPELIKNTKLHTPNNSRNANDKTIESMDIKTVNKLIEIEETKKKKKKRKIRKMPPDFPHVGHLVPNNLSQEKKEFFANKERYNPKFQYNIQINKFSKNKPDTKYISIAKKIIESALKFYGSHKNFVNSGGNIITKNDTQIFIDNYLKEAGLSHKVSYLFIKN